MKKKIILGIAVFLLLSLVGLSIILTSDRKSEAQNLDLKVPILVTQLPLDNGQIPVKINCDEMILTNPNEIDNLPCNIRNNTTKPITAMVVSYEIFIEEKETPKTFSGVITVEILLHPDFYEERKQFFISPEEVTPISLLNTIFDTDNVIKKVAIQIDFVEFADKSTISKDENGLRLIKEVREGVIKAKSELTLKIKENKNLENTFETIVQNELFNKNDLNELTAKQFEGVKIFQKYILKIYKTKGMKEVKRILGAK